MIVGQLCVYLRRRPDGGIAIDSDVIAAIPGVEQLSGFLRWVTPADIADWPEITEEEKTKLRSEFGV